MVCTAARVSRRAPGASSSTCHRLGQTCPLAPPLTRCSCPNPRRSGCVFDGKSLATKNLSGALLVDASLKKADMTEARKRRSVFSFLRACRPVAGRARLC